MSLPVGVTMLGRKQAERLIVASGTLGVIRRQTGVTVTDPITLQETPVWAVVYTGPGKVRQGEASPQVSSIPGAQITDQRAILSLPVAGSGNVRTDDVWEFTANPLDQSSVGRRLRIAGVVAGTFVTARRFPVVEVS